VRSWWIILETFTFSRGIPGNYNSKRPACQDCAGRFCALKHKIQKKNMTFSQFVEEPYRKQPFRRLKNTLYIRVESEELRVEISSQKNPALIDKINLNSQLSALDSFTD
jgi:hypothetical protein